MGAERASKAAIRQLAVLLETDRAAARTFLQEVQVRCGRLPFRTIMDEMQSSGIVDLEGICQRINAGTPFLTVPNQDG